MADEHATTQSESGKVEGSLHFIEQIIADDLSSGEHARIHTRFPPEPNGYLHIGHAKAIHLSFGLAEKYDGLVNLRFDDTNPEKEEQEYVDAIRRDISWLGYAWNGGEFYTSDYFEQLYGFAVKLIEGGKAYVDHQSAEVMAAQKGSPTSPGTASPHRDRPVEENLRLFVRSRPPSDSAPRNRREPISWRSWRKDGWSSGRVLVGIASRVPGLPSRTRLSPGPG